MLTIDSFGLESQQHQQPMLNTDMLLTEDFLGLNKEDTESFFNSLSDEDLFSSSSEVSTPQIPTAQPNFGFQFFDQNNNNPFQFAMAAQDPNNNILNFQTYQIPAQNPFGANFTIVDSPIVIKQEKEQSRPQSFMILPQTPSTPKAQTPRVMTFEQDSEDSDNDLDMYEPAPKVKRTSASQRGRGKQTPIALPQVVSEQAALQIPAGAQTVFVTPKPTKRKMMEKFSEDKLSDFKRVIYNLLVEHHNQCLQNNTDQIDAFVLPIKVQEGEKVRTGFQFNEAHGPEKKLPELYAKHIRNAHLEKEDSSSVFIQDLYRFYMRACLELLGKYFDKRGKFTFLYDEETPLFVPGHSLAQAEVRIRSMKTRARMNKKRKSSN